MRKSTNVTLLVLVSMILGVCSIANAEYKDSVKPDIGAVVADYYKQEQGNKVTEYGIRGLLQKLEAVLDKNHIAPEPKPEVPEEE